MSQVHIDYSQPLITLLRFETQHAHDSAANSRGAQLLLSGQLPKAEYVRYLMMLWHIYNTLEQALDKHASHPALEQTYNPTLLARSASLSADISHLLQCPEPSWPSHPIHTSLITSPPPALTAYLTRISTLADTDPAALLAHSYTRYLGDLSGGQIIRYTIVKSYDLNDASGLGVQFYEFKSTLNPNKPATQGEMKRIKEWFKNGVNAAGNLDAHIKEVVLKETSTVFTLNAGLFDSIRIPSDTTLSFEEPSKEDLSTVQAVDRVQAKPTSISIPRIALFMIVANFSTLAYGRRLLRVFINIGQGYALA